MNITSRSYLTAGVAALTVGTIALTPIHPLPNQVAMAPQRAVSTMSVELAAAINPIQPWIDLTKDALTNTGNLFKAFAAGLYVDGTIPAPENTLINGQLGSRTGGYAAGKPFPFLQQFIANQISYLQQLPDIRGIISEIFGNTLNALTAPITPGETKPGTVLGIPGQYNQNVNGVVFSNPVPGAVINQRTVLALLAVLAPVEYATLKPILDFTTAPISGVLVGAIGPVLGPVLSVIDSVKAIFTAIKARQWATAINETLNIPANAVNAFLNGGPTLDLTKVLGGVLPGSVKTFGVRMGGLLSPGGVGFDGVTADVEATLPGPIPLNLAVPGNLVGPIGALIGLRGYEANAIKPPQTLPGASRRQARAAASESGTPAQSRRAERKATAGAAKSNRAPRAASARSAG